MIQLQVLNKILSDKDASLITLNNLTSDYFSDYKNEFEYIDNHYKTYGVIPDLETFLSKFSNFELIKVNEKDSYLISELYKDKQTRTLASTFNKVRNLLMDGKTEEATSVYTSAVEELSVGVSLNTVDLLKDTSRYDAYIERLTDFDKYYISTGFKELDDIIGGWDREEELATIVARTNYGKSWVLLKCAIAAVEQGLNVGIYSGEMSERKVGYRIDTLISHIPNGALIHGNDSIQLDYKKYIDELPTKYQGSLKVLTPKMINGPAGVSALRAFIEKDNLDILFIDQHSLLEDDRKAKNPVEKAANISKDLKNLQVLKRIPVITVSQQNRSATETGNVDTTQIAQSDRIGQDSTCIIFLEKKEDIMKMSLVKSRDSENGKVISYIIDFNKGVWTYIPAEDDGVKSSKSDEAAKKFEQRYEQKEPEGLNVFD